MADGGEARDGYLMLAGRRVHFLEWGDPAAPPVVLLHGVWETARVWDAVARALAADYHVLAPDQRGHGETDHAEDYRWLRWADDVGAFAQALGLGRFALVGSSAGCVVAFSYASRFPGTLTHLALIEHGPDATEQVRALIARLGRSIAAPAHVDPALSLPALFDLVEPPDLTDEWARLPLITCPTLIVRAERSDRFPLATAERMCRLIPDSRFMQISNSRHTVPTDAPDSLAAALMSFLNATTGF